MMDDSIDLNISTSSPYDMLSGMSTINISSPTDDGRRRRNNINGGGTAIDNAVSAPCFCLFYPLKWSKKALKSLNQCVGKLHEVDIILNEFTIFWGKMENALTSIIQKNTHVESMLNFTHNQKLRKRFFLRLDEYHSLWREIGAVCSSYLINEQSLNDTTANRSTVQMHNFLTSSNPATTTELIVVD